MFNSFLKRPGKRKLPGKLTCVGRNRLSYDFSFTLFVGTIEKGVWDEKLTLRRLFKTRDNVDTKRLKKD